MNYKFISFYLIAYMVIYIISHLPFDILMYLKKRDISYPNPQFKSFREGFFFVVTSIAFWVCIIIFPPIALIFNVNLFTIHDLQNFTRWIQLVIQFVGIIILSIGLIIGCLGRIGRGMYLARENSYLSTKWGHAIVRHPSYFQYISGFIGLPLLTFNPFYLLFILGIQPYISVALVEDKALEEFFGNDFINYKKRVGFLFPKIKIKIKKNSK